MIVKVYSTPACPYCYTLKEFLKERGISFEDIDISQDEKIKEDMIKRSGQMAVPVVEINGQMIIGFDRQKILNLLSIKE